jgi:NADPH:quinone reductase-like Zn-dependent oxidoreductase
VPVPEIGPGEVLVRVHAAGINPPDWYLREGMKVMPAEMRPALEFPLIPGTDMSGVVREVAPDVLGFAVGDEVFGMLRFPGFDGRTYAQYVAAPAADLAPKPAGIDHVQAAGAPMAVLTAWQYLVDLGHDVPSPFTGHVHQPVPITPDMTVLVNGAAGGVGHFAVQLAKWKGAHVIAVASGRHEQFLRKLGADGFIDYTRTQAADVVSGVDLVIDAVGGPDSARFLTVLKRGGTMLPVFFAHYDPEETASRGHHSLEHSGAFQRPPTRGNWRPVRRRKAPGRGGQHLPAARGGQRPRASRAGPHPRQDRPGTLRQGAGGVGTSLPPAR